MQKKQTFVLIMAIAIKSIPVLRGKLAEQFIDKAEKNLSKRATIDFSKQVQIANRILEKAKMK